MRRFMYLSIGVLCLALSALIGFHIGSRTAEAQAPGIAFAFTTEEGTQNHYVMMENGDVYSRGIIYSDFLPIYVYDDPYRQLHYVGNFWDTPPVRTDNTTWGGIKSLMDGKKD